MFLATLLVGVSLYMFINWVLIFVLFFVAKNKNKTLFINLLDEYATDLLRRVIAIVDIFYNCSLDAVGAIIGLLIIAFVPITVIATIQTIINYKTERFTRAISNL